MGVVFIAGLLEAICAGLMDEISGICRVGGGGSCGGRRRFGGQCSDDYRRHGLALGVADHDRNSSSAVVC